MTAFNIPRTGQKSLAFDGELLAHVSGHSAKNPRWHEVSLYRTQEGVYVAHVAFRCNSEYDTGRDDVCISHKQEVIVEFLNTHQPTRFVRGWPGEKHKAQDVRLREKLTQAYRTLVSQALSATSELSEKIS